MYIIHVEHVSVRSSIFLGLNSNMWATVVDSPGLELQMMGPSSLINIYWGPLCTRYYAGDAARE